jgi:hypothetical protein
MREAPDVESSSPDYALRFAGSVGEWFLQTQSTFTLRALEALPRGQIVDVGGGHAQLTPALLRSGFDVVVYGSPEASRERISPFLASGSCRFVSGDLASLPFPDRSFEAALCFRILPHLADWRRLIAELCRVSSRSVVVDFPAWRSVNVGSSLLFRVKRGIEASTRPYRLFSRREIREAFAACEFTVTWARPQFLLPMALHRFTDSARWARLLEAPGRALGMTRLLGSPVVVRADRSVR